MTRIMVSMSEETTYEWTFEAAELAKHLNLPETTDAEVLDALVNGKGHEAAGMTEAAYDAAQDEFDGTLLDQMLNNFAACDDRKWEAKPEPVRTPPPPPPGSDRALAAEDEA